VDEGLAWCGGGRFGEGRQGWLLPVAAVAAAQSMILLVPWMLEHWDWSGGSAPRTVEGIGECDF
jgi:hypothetical protein